MALNADTTRVTLALLLVEALLACADPTVSVGQAGDSIDLTRCQGSGVVCDLEQATDDFYVDGHTARSDRRVIAKLER